MPATRLPHVRFAAQGDHPAVNVPAIGQGTWYMGEGLAPHRDEVRALQEGLELGLSLIDTAEMYGEGGAEKVVSEALAGRREQAFLVSKVYPWNAGRESTIDACERSLKRLGTDHLDLYLLHWPGDIPLEETLEAFTRLQEQGKVHRFGVSNFDVDDMQALFAQPGGETCVTDQVLYHLGSRGIETHLHPWLHERGLPMMAYCPLAQGGRLQNELMSHPEVLDIAAELGITPAQLLLAWAIRPQAGQHEVVAIPKAVQREHVSQNARALEIRLDDHALARLDAAFPPPNHRVPLDIV